MTTPEWATLGVAALASLLSGINLWVIRAGQIRAERATTELETVRWIRQTLHGVALDYLRTAFFISGASGNARVARLEGHTLQDVEPLLKEIQASHDALADRLTSLRLLGSPDLITAAQTLHDSHHDLINIAFGTADPTDEEVWQKAKDRAKREREIFINCSRTPLGLEPSPVSIGASVNSSWRVPADVPHPVLARKWQREPN